MTTDVEQNPDTNLPQGDQPDAAGAKPGGTPADISSPPETPEVEPTGNLSLDLALDAFAKVGLSQKHPAVKAALETGDFAVVEALIKDKGDAGKGVDKFVALAKEAVEKQKAAAEAKQAEAKKVVFDAVGGEERWATIRTWAQKEATAEQAEAVNAALKAGGLTAKVMASWLADQYDQKNGGGAPAKRDALPPTAARPGGAAPLSPADYRRELSALVARIGANRLDSSPEYVQLRARRQAYRG